MIPCVRERLVTRGTVPIVGGAEITPVHQGDEDHEGQEMIFTQLFTICQTRQ